MGRKSGWFWLACLALILASLACEINLGGPETPEPPIPVSTEAVESLKDLWKAARDGAQDDGQITLVVNQAQLTSLLTYRLQEQEDPLFQEPQVYLQDGQVQIYGTVQRGNLKATSRVVITVQIDDEGRPQLELASADFGPFPVPEGLLSGLSAMLDEAFTGSIGPGATGLRIESIVIQDGLMAITGRIR